MCLFKLTCRTGHFLDGSHSSHRSGWVLLLIVWLAVLSGCDQAIWTPTAPKVAGYEICSVFSEGRALVRSSESRNFGYINPGGRVIIPAHFESADDFSEGLAAVRRHYRDGYQYLDSAGQVAVAGPFDAALRFSEGRAAVKVNGKFGYINRDGALVIPAQFDDAFEFHDGMARVVRDGLIGFIDLHGTTIIPPRFFKASDFYDGLAAACLQTRCGYVLKNGATAVNFVFDDAKPFSAGLAPVRAGDWWGYINPRGEWVISPRYFEAHPFTEGVALVGQRKNFSFDQKFGGYTGLKTFYGFIAPDGREILTPRILGATPFASGLSKVQLPAGGLCSDCYYYRFLQRDGALLPGKFDTATPFERGQAIVTAYGLTGKQHAYLIDAAGKALFEFEGRGSQDFAFWAKSGRGLRYGYVDRTGQPVIAHQFATAQPFRGGRALVSLKAAQHFINPSGQLMLKLPTWVTRAFPFSEGLALVVNKASRFGYLDEAGQVRIEPQYHAALPFSEGLAAVKVSRDPGENNWGYIDAQGKMAIEPAFHRAGPFIQGLAVVEIISPERYLVTALINPTGQIVIREPHLPRFLHLVGHHPSYEGLEQLRRLSFAPELVPKWRKTGGGMGFVDRADQFVISDPVFLDAAPFSEGLAPVLIRVQGEYAGLWGYINPHGEVAIKPQFITAEAFSDGLALVKDAAGRLGYLDHTGQWAIPPSFFEEAMPFSEGLALVKLNGRYGFIDKASQWAIPPRYFRAEPYAEGLAVTAIERNLGGQ